MKGFGCNAAFSHRFGHAAGARRYGEAASAYAEAISLNPGFKVRDPGLEELKTDPLMDPLRQEPRFQAMLRELNFPRD